MTNPARPPASSIAIATALSNPRDACYDPKFVIRRKTPALFDQQQFYQLLSYKGDFDLEAKLDEWKRFYNFARTHAAYHGQTAYEALSEKL